MNFESSDLLLGVISDALIWYQIRSLEHPAFLDMFCVKCFVQPASPNTVRLCNVKPSAAVTLAGSARFPGQLLLHAVCLTDEARSWLPEDSLVVISAL